VIVIDASALVKFILKEEGWERIYKILFTRVVSVDHIVKEVANAIWKHCSIHKTYPPDVTLKEFQLLKKIIDEKLVLLESELKYLDKAFEIAVENSIPVYDALYIAQAITHNIPLATSDKRQAEIAEKLKVQVIFIP
jgi:predicted nucleic acid-binding protein